MMTEMVMEITKMDKMATRYSLKKIILFHLPLETKMSKKRPKRSLKNRNLRIKLQK